MPSSEEERGRSRTRKTSTGDNSDGDVFSGSGGAELNATEVAGAAWDELRIQLSWFSNIIAIDSEVYNQWSPQVREIIRHRMM